jgi:multidrug efflux pump subunit AcrA (membrane-fusion protein)
LGSSSAGGSSTSTTSSSSSSGFITIENLDKLDVVAGFAEADVANIKVGDTATITFPALTDVDAEGIVTSVAPTSTVSSNVVTYDVTIALRSPPSVVRLGMTADVNVITQTRTNVLLVPSSAVTTTGNASTVTILQGRKSVTRPVVIGLVGASTTEIVSGLSVGEVVVESTSTSTAGSSTPTTTGGGGFGGGLGGGGGFGGGGFGGGAP